MEKREPSANGDRLDDDLRRLYAAPVPVSFQESWKNAVRREENVQMSEQINAQARQSHSWNRFFRVAAPLAAALVLVVGSLWAGGQKFSESPEAAGISESVSRSGGAASKTTALYSTANTADSAMYNMAAEEAYDGASEQMAPNGKASYSMTAAGTVGDAGSGAAVQPAAAEARKLVRTADLTLRTAAYDQDLQALRELLASLGGYVESEYQSGDAANGDSRSANLSLRVPSDGLDAFLSGAEGLGRVVSRSESSTDMTVQYADNEARLQVLRQKMTRLNELLQQAESVEDIIQIENALADAQYQIDSYETSQRSIDRQVDMSRVSLTLWEDDPIQPTSEMSMGQRLSAALAASMGGIGRFFRNMLVFAVMALPVAIPLAVLGLVIWLAARRRRKNRMSGDDPGTNKPIL